MRKFEMSPNGEYQEKMTESLYNASFRFDLDYDILQYLQTHMTNREPRELLEGYLLDRQVEQIMAIQDELRDYSGPHNVLYLRSMMEQLGVDGATSQSVDVDARMVTVDWNEISGMYRDFEERSVRSEYARVRETARENREDRFDIVVKNELIEALEL